MFRVPDATVGHLQGLLLPFASSSNDNMEHDTRDLLVDALSEFIARELEYEALEKLSEEDLHRIADAALYRIERIEAETDRSIEGLLAEESELLEVLRDLEEETAGEEMAEGGFEVPDGQWDQEGGT